MQNGTNSFASIKFTLYYANPTKPNSEEIMTEETQTETQERKSGSRLARIIVLLLLLGAIIAVLYFFVIKKQDNQSTAPKGAITEVDDFYHAKDGTWKMETTIHLLKEKKFVSGDAELKSYLVHTAKPGDIVRISQAAGRWKKLEVLKDDKVIATGWADAEDGQAELQISENK